MRGQRGSVHHHITQHYTEEYLYVYGNQTDCFPATKWFGENQWHPPLWDIIWKWKTVYLSSVMANLRIWSLVTVREPSLALLPDFANLHNHICAVGEDGRWRWLEKGRVCAATHTAVIYIYSISYVLQFCIAIWCYLIIISSFSYHAVRPSALRWGGLGNIMVRTPLKVTALQGLKLLQRVKGRLQILPKTSQSYHVLLWWQARPVSQSHHWKFIQVILSRISLNGF